MFGCLLAGFYLLRVYDMPTATYVAVAINAAVAFAGWRLANAVPYESSEVAEPLQMPRPAHSRSIYIAIAISGLCALGAEVIWTRLLSPDARRDGLHIFDYPGVFLVGLGLGSGVAVALVAPESAGRAWRWECARLLLAAAVAWTAYACSPIRFPTGP